VNLSREQMLAEMGITPSWRLRQTVTAAAEPAEAVEVQGEAAIATPPQSGAPAAPAGAAAIHDMDWETLESAIGECRACELCQHRRRTVPGVGDRTADWLFIGEGPGAEEDARGEPFVGQAGKLLDNMLFAIGLERTQRVYIANAVKCRPPGNRTPEPAEMAACRPFLERQIALVQPRVIVLLGRAAVHSVLGEDRALSALRGKRLDYRGIPVVVTYHPAYLLRNLPEKAKSWEDLLFARRLLREAAEPELAL
jgi:uracil-DNA glycosylase family 4